MYRRTSAKLTRPLAQIIDRLLQTSPAERYPTARSLGAALGEFLRQSGLTAPRDQLRAYFTDPEGFWQGFLPQLVSTLIASGKELVAEGRTAAALAAWSRVLALDSSHAEAQALIAKASRRQRAHSMLLTVGLGLASAAVVAGVGVYSIQLLRRPVPNRPLTIVPRADLASEDAVEHSDTDKAPTIAVDDQPIDGPRFDLGGDLGAGKQRPLHKPTSPRTPAAPRSVRLEPWPKSVTVSHNGKRLGAYGTDVRSVQLLPGANEFVFENPACYSEKVTLPADSTVEEIRVRLRWKPALLLVKARSAKLGPSDAVDVVVDGRVVGRGGQVMAIPVAGDEGQQTVSVQVSAQNHHSLTRAVQVRANQLLTLEVELPAR